MTREDVNARNRRNAKKSTGPRTDRGKAVVSGNARRHGATSRPEPGTVVTWLSVILDQPDLAEEGVIMPRSDREACAVTLAQEEARLTMARQALYDFEAGLEAPSDALEDLRHMRDDIREFILENDKVGKRDLLKAMGFFDKLQREEMNDTALGGKGHGLLQRYLREARSRRRRAFEAWIKVNMVEAEA